MHAFADGWFVGGGLQLWGAELSSVADVRQVFAGFLEGKLSRLPWCARLDEESIDLQPNLVQMNLNGLLTINSQVRKALALSLCPPPPLPLSPSFLSTARCVSRHLGELSFSAPPSTPDLLLFRCVHSFVCKKNTTKQMHTPCGRQGGVGYGHK